MYGDEKSNKNLLTLSTQQTPLVCRIFSVRERSLLCRAENMYVGKSGTTHTSL